MMRTTLVKNVRRSESGQALLEFFFAVLIAMVFILGVIQIGMIFNAHSMVKLAAFNAARAAIVARDPNTSRPEDPVTLEEMRSRARLAAFLTLIPVIPEGFVPANLSDFTQFFSLSGIQRLGRTALEFTCCFNAPVFPDQPANAGRGNFIDVKFLPAGSSDISAAEVSTPAPRLEFDDRSRSQNPQGNGDPNDPNLIKVVVTWQYPLVIPIANRIIIAAVRPVTYFAALLVAGANPFLAAQVVAIRNNAEAMPVWALGTSMDRVFTLDNIFRFTWRVPIRGSYVMRMQWDRRPS